MTPALDDADALAGAESAAAARLARGDSLSAYDKSQAARDAGLDSVRLRYLNVRALAATGDSAAALARYHALDVGAQGDADSLALEGRILKDMAFAGGGDADARLAEAAAAYVRAFDRSGDAFPGINAASLLAMQGEGAQSAAILAQLAAILGDGPPADYWAGATRVEAALLQHDGAALARLLDGGGWVTTGDAASRASTCLQVRRLAASGAVDSAAARTVCAALRPGPVVTYSGHMFRSDAAAEARISAAIGAELDQLAPSALVGPLACGADILFAEAALAREIDLVVVMPFDGDDFKAISVLSGGAAWGARHDAALAAASRVVAASAAQFVGDDLQFKLGSLTGMGVAILRAAALETDAVQLVVAQGEDVGPRARSEHAGTHADQAMWQATGRASIAIAAGPVDRRLDFPPTPAMAPVPRGQYALLFGDYAGFSKLREADLPLFEQDVLGRIGAVLAAHGDAVLFRNTWGDAVYAVIEQPQAAAAIALAIQAVLRDLPAALGTAADGAGMRIGLHYGPLFRGQDPVTAAASWYGTEVTRTARIEPVTPTRSVFCTESFAAALALAGTGGFDCHYVGRITLAKDYGALAMYRLSDL
ncbi:MAG: hypothetical protein RLZZ58_1508 [Pseudomonadota bacterium]